MNCCDLRPTSAYHYSQDSRPLLNASFWAIRVLALAVLMLGLLNTLTHHVSFTMVAHVSRGCAIVLFFVICSHVTPSVHQMPVLNVFERHHLKLPTGLPGDASYVVFFSTCFQHDIESAREKLPSTLQWTTVAQQPQEGDEKIPSIFGRSNVSNIEARGLLFLAETIDDPLLTLVSLQFFGVDCPIIAWINDTGTLMDLRANDSLALNRKLTKRFSLIERTRDANSVGILVSMTSTKSGVAVMKKMKKLVRSAGKKPYLLVVGKINEPKLLNWPHLDVYCLLSCPFTALEVCDEMTTNYRAVITPYELQLACAPGVEWNARWFTELQDVVRIENNTPVVLPEETNVEVIPSLSTAIVAATTSKEIVQRIMELSPATRYLQQRATWTGVDPVAPTEASAAVEGRTGTARNYSGEGRAASTEAKRSTRSRPHIVVEREPSSESASEEEMVDIVSLF